MAYIPDALYGWTVDETAGELVFTLTWYNQEPPYDSYTTEYRVPYTSRVEKP